ncbi:hypothetical protein FACS189472_05920 [Alphaproteobacteria bacterium]|nr:hypothetical protein FACS189472_05920 [Alphaproteobacteria bacterium]
MTSELESLYELESSMDTMMQVCKNTLKNIRKVINQQQQRTNDSSSEESVEVEGEWEELKMNGNYEIITTYPFRVRRKDKRRVKKEGKNKEGYHQIQIGDRTYCKHVVVATQWIPNPDDLPCVDHINHQRDDNHIENLRWVSYSDNSKNFGGHKKNGLKNQYEYTNELPKGSRQVKKFNGWEFDNLYYNDGEFYIKVHVSYRKLVVFGDRTKHVNTYDTSNKYRGISLNKFTKALKDHKIEFEEEHVEIEEDHSL